MLSDRAPAGKSFPHPAYRLSLEFLEGRVLLTSYSIMDLGTLGGDSSAAYDINSSNQVVGYAKSSTGADRAFLFQDANNNHIVDSGEMHNLGSLPDYASSYAHAINNNGVIVGRLLTSANAQKAVRFQTTAEPTDLGMGTGSTAYDVNINGDIVGASFVGPSYLAAHRAPNGQVTNLGALGGGFPYSEAFAINDSGTIVGYASTDTGDSAFVLPVGGSMSAIGFANQPHFFEYDYAWGINNSGQVVGEGFNSFAQYHAFRYDNGNFTDLGVPAGFTATQALAINNSGIIVGHGKNAANQGRAFIFIDGVALDLNSLVSPDSGWTLTKARSINDNGYIVGEGISPSGQTHAFLLAPPPAPLTINGDQNTLDQDDTIILRRSAIDSSLVEVFLNSPAPTSSFIATENIHLFVNSGGGNDQIILDFSNGSPLPAGGTSIDGQATGADVLHIIGSSGPDNINIGGAQISFGSAAANFANIESIQVDGGEGDDAFVIDESLPFMPLVSGNAGDDSLTINSGVYTLVSDASASSIEQLALHSSATLNLDHSQHLSSLTVDGTARMNLLPNGSHFIRAGQLTVGGSATVDLSDNDLIIDTTSPDSVLETVTALIRSARNVEPRWGGVGLTSSAAASSVITGLAALVNNDGSGQAFRTSLSGEALATNSVLVLYTYTGDLDANGAIDNTDYALIDQGYIQKLIGYHWGDIDYSGGPPDADDLFYIDRAFYNQSGPLISDLPLAPLSENNVETGSTTPASSYEASPFSSKKRIKFRRHSKSVLAI
jgi:probable HAF family extracellular repeat protein